MRTKPYTERGIRRLKCFRPGCSNRARFQWQICSDGNQFRPVCVDCDIDLNRMVLEWSRMPDSELKFANYRRRLAA